MAPFALFYAVSVILGDLEGARYRGLARNAGRFALWFLGSYAVLLALCILLSNRSAITRRLPFGTAGGGRAGREENPRVWLIFTALCLLAYLPYYLMYYPGWLNNDALWQIEQILGLAERSNHHPYFHTLLMQVFFGIGCRLSGTYEGGAAFYTFVQVAVMAAVFAFFLYRLYLRGARALWLVLALLFYAVCPINALLTICMGKDEFFTAALLLFAWFTATLDPDAEENAAQDRTGRRKKRFGWLAWSAAGLLVCLLRSNGVFIYAGTAFCLLAKKLRRTAGGGRFPRRTFLCTAAVLACYLLWHGPILGALRVQPPDIIESLTMPTQHLLCAYLKGGELTEEETALLGRVIPLDKAAECYHPRLFDPIKNLIRESGNQQEIAEHKGEYFRLWLRVGLRNPLQYLVAQVRQTAGFWAYSVPDYEYVYGEYYMIENPLGIETERKLFTYDAELAMHEYLMGFLDLYNRVWSLGLNTWLMVFCLAYALYRGKDAMIFVPFVMLLVTLFLATPVYNEFRYAYGLFAAFPMLFHLTFGGEQEESGSTGPDRYRIREMTVTEDEKMG